MEPHAQNVLWPTFLSPEQMSQGIEVDLCFARQDMICRECSGTGYVDEHVCPLCHGTGLQYVARSLTVALPSGIADGEHITIERQGAYDLDTGDYGGLAVVCWLQLDGDLKIDNGELVSIVDVPAAAAQSGGRFRVSTPVGPTLVDLQAPVWDGREYLVPEHGLRRSDNTCPPLRIRARLVQESGESGSQSADRATSLRYAEQARTALREGNVTKAVRLSSEAVVADPSLPLAHTVLGLSLARTGDLQGALPELKVATRLDHRDASSWYHLASLYYRLGMLLPAAVAAHAARLRRLRSEKLQGLWRKTVRGIFVDDIKVEQSVGRLRNGMERVAKQVLARYFGTALPMVDDMIADCPDCALLHYQRAAVLWFLSIDGPELRLADAYVSLVRAIHLDLTDQTTEYGPTLREIDNLIGTDGAPSELISAATQMIEVEHFDDAPGMLMSARHKFAERNILSFYQVVASELRAAVQASALEDRGKEESRNALDQCLSLIEDKSGQIEDASALLMDQRQALEEPVGTVRALCQEVCAATGHRDASWLYSQLRTATRVVTQSIKPALQTLVGGSNRWSQPGPAIHELCSGASALIERMDNSLMTISDTASAESTNVAHTCGDQAEELQEIVSTIDDLVSASRDRFNKLSAQMGKMRGVGALTELAYSTQFRPAHLFRDLRQAVTAIDSLHGHLHFAPEDAESRKLLDEALQEFRKLVKPMLDSDYGAQSDLFHNTADSIRSGIAAEHAFALSMEDLCKSSNLVLFDWAADVLIREQPVFSGEFLISAKRDGYALTNYRLAYLKPGTTQFLSIPLHRIGSYEPRASGLTTMNVVIDLKDGTRLVLNDLHKGLVASEAVVRWAAGTEMWQNLPEGQYEALDTGQQAEALPQPVAVGTRALPESDTETDELPALPDRVTCPACGTLALPDDMFCRQCGKSLVVDALPADESEELPPGGLPESRPNPEQGGGVT